MNSLSSRFTEVRLHLGLSKTELAKELKVSKSAVGQIEDGSTRTLNSSTLSNFCKLSGVNAEWILNGKGPKYPPDRAGATLDALISAAKGLSQDERKKLLLHLSGFDFSQD